MLEIFRTLTGIRIRVIKEYDEAFTFYSLMVAEIGAAITKHFEARL